MAQDLTLTLRDGGFISILRSEALVRPRPQVKGTHRPEGIFIAGGPGIRRGARIAALPILAVAPTLFYSLGVPVPEDLEGAVATEAFEAELRDAIEKGPIPDLLKGPAASHQRLSVHLRGPHRNLPEGIAARVIRIGNLSEKISGTNLIRLRIFENPHRYI